MTPPQPIGVQPIGAMSSSRVILGELLSSRARLRFSGQHQSQPKLPRLPRIRICQKEVPVKSKTLLLPESGKPYQGDISTVAE